MQPYLFCLFKKKTWYRSYGHKLSQFVKSKTWKVIVRTLSRSLGSYRTVSYKGPQQHTSVNLFKEESLWSSLYENRETKNIDESHSHTPTIEQQVLDYRGMNKCKYLQHLFLIFFLIWSFIYVIHCCHFGDKRANSHVLNENLIG